MAPTHFSGRKFVRKVYKDGFHSALASSIEAIYRRKIFPKTFRFLVNNGKITVLNDEDIHQRSHINIRIDLGDSTAFISEFDSVFVLPESGLVLTDELELVNAAIGAPEYSRKFTMEALAHHDFISFWLTPRLLLDRKLHGERIQDQVCVLTPRYKNYYHWMVGTVPKLRYVEKYKEETGNEVVYLLPKDLPKWGRETISLLGYSQNKFINAQSAVYRPDNIILPPHPYPGHSIDYYWIRNKVFNNLDSSEEASNRIYISRSNAIGRQISNETEVVDVLKDFGFKKLRLEERSVSQNIREFMHAEVIVAPHGAGLTDIIFCDTDCTVLELFGSQKTEAYEQLSEILGLEYRRMDCQPDGTDLIVDTDQLRQALGEIFRE